MRYVGLCGFWNLYSGCAVSRLKYSVQVVEPSNFQTLEALAALVARICLESFPMPQVTVSIDKPNALTFVDGAGVEIMRDRRWLSMR